MGIGVAKGVVLLIKDEKLIFFFKTDIYLRFKSTFMFLDLDFYIFSLKSSLETFKFAFKR